MTDPESIWLGFSTKAYFNLQQTVDWMEVAKSKQHPGIRPFMAVSTLALHAAVQLSGGEISIGSQDVDATPSGAFTGAIPAQFLVDAGAEFVELGHKEQQQAGDTQQRVREKVKAAREVGLRVLLCVGEETAGTSSDAARICLDQIRAADIDLDNCIIAYEPRWAIGAQQPAPTRYVAEVASELRLKIKRTSSPLIYGGTAGPGMISELFPAVDGLFLGRMVHDPRQYLAVFDEASGLL